MQQISGLKQASQQLDVYGGPNNNNAKIGTVFNNEVISLFGTERGYAYVEYSTTNGAKRGYLIESALRAATPPSLPSLSTYTGFSSGTYGTSGLGQSLKYYKIGNGPNVAFAVFAQHGWEDAWASDGVELVNIADRVMQGLSSSGINSNWTLYIIPYANPDGITNGYTNNGPGRCTITTKIDMNRSWPANFAPYYTSRNYTGDTSLGSPEGVALKNFISSNIGSGEKIVLDIHGWLNQTYGDYSIAQYFDNQFGFGHSSSYGSGYLETWGKSIGAKSCLIELPMPSSSQDIIERNFSGKLTNGIRNMLAGSGSSEGGTEVLEKVKVTACESLNVRSGPGTTYSILTSVVSGTIVTRIRKSVISSNGYTWDKIRLDNGIVGYVATNYLELYTNQVNYKVNGYTFTLNKLESSLSNETINNINTGENEYGKMDPVQMDQNLEKLEKTQNTLNLLCTVGSALDTAGPALSRYKSNTGDFLHHEHGADMFSSSPKALSKLTDLESAAIAATEQMTSSGNNQFNFALDVETGVQLENINIMNKSLGELIQEYITSIEKLDWYLAFGYTRIELVCNVEKVNGKIILTTTYNLNDYYDWNKNDTDKMFGMVTQQELWQLHYAGIARNFNQEATYVRILEWNTGDISTAKVTSEFSK